jgi:hypothetical protein
MEANHSREAGELLGGRSFGRYLRDQLDGSCVDLCSTIPCEQDWREIGENGAGASAATNGPEYVMQEPEGIATKKHKRHKVRRHSPLSLLLARLLCFFLWLSASPPDKSILATRPPWPARWMAGRNALVVRIDRLVMGLWWTLSQRFERHRHCSLKLRVVSFAKRFGSM